MSKRKAREEDNQQIRTPFPVLYYPEDDGVRPTQCVMPPTSPILSSHYSPVHHSSFKDSNKRSLSWNNSSVQRRGSALENIGYAPENIPTPRTRPKTSLFTAATRASSSRYSQAFPTTSGSPRRATPTKIATISDNDANLAVEADGTESEYVVDSSDGEVPERFRIPKRANPQASPKPRSTLDRAALTASSSPFRACVTPVQQRLRRPSEPPANLIFPGPSPSQSPPVSHSKRPHVSNPSPISNTEVIVVSSSDSESERRAVSGSPSLGEYQPPARATYSAPAPVSACSTPAPRTRSPASSSRSSDIVLLDFPPRANDPADSHDSGEVEELFNPSRRLSAHSSTSPEQRPRQPRRRTRLRRIDSSPVQEHDVPSRHSVNNASPSESGFLQRTKQVPEEHIYRSVEQTTLEPVQYIASASRQPSRVSLSPAPTPWSSDPPLFRPPTKTTTSTLTPLSELDPAILSRTASRSVSFQPEQAHPLPDELVLSLDGLVPTDEFVAQRHERLLSSDEPSPSPVKPIPHHWPNTTRVLRMECVLLPRASRAMRKAMARFDLVQERALSHTRPNVQAPEYARGKGKSAAILLGGGVSTRFAIEIPVRGRPSKGKAAVGGGLGKGKGKGNYVMREESPSLGENEGYAGTGDTDEDYRDTVDDDGNTNQSLSDAVDVPEISSPRKRGGKPDRANDAVNTPSSPVHPDSSPGGSNQNRPIKYLVIDTRLASPSAYDSLPLEIEDSPNRYCHCCRGRGMTGKLKMRCSNIVNKRWRGRKLGPQECGTLWCQRCIAKHDIPFNPVQPDFICPLCTHSCDCNVCRRERGQRPLGRNVIKVVKQKPGRRPLDAMAHLAEDDEEPPAPMPLTFVHEAPSFVKPTSQVPEGPTTWYGPHTPPPLRRRRALGARVLATEDHIFVPRRPRERQSEDPTRKGSNLRAEEEGSGKEAEELGEEDGESSGWEKKLRIFEGDYSSAADATLLGADSAAFDMNLETETDGPEENVEQTGLVSPMHASARTSIEPEIQVHGDRVNEVGAETQVNQFHETFDLAHEVKILSEAILSLGPGDPNLLNDTVLDELDAGIEYACRHFYGSQVCPDIHSTPDPDPRIDIFDSFNVNHAQSCDEQTEVFDLGHLHPEGTFDTVPGISMTGDEDSASNDSICNIPLYHVATHRSDEVQTSSTPQAEYTQPIDNRLGNELEPESQPLSKPLPIPQCLSALQHDVEDGHTPKVEPLRHPEPFSVPNPEPEPKLLTATDPESAHSTSLETSSPPSPQLGTYGSSGAGFHNLFENPCNVLGLSTLHRKSSIADSTNIGTSPAKERQGLNESSVSTIAFVLPDQEQQKQMREALRTRFQTRATVPSSQAETKILNTGPGKTLRSKRRYDV